MRAIILAGGFGTRLRSVVADVPKPMAPIQEKPFLAYLLDYLCLQGMTEIILSVYYLREQIQNYFQSSYRGMKISYVIEEQPLGTGGAIIFALKHLNLRGPLFVLNGDTFLKLNYRAMYAAHQKQNSLISMALRKIANCNRYGTVQVENNSVTAFNEQGGDYPGFINAGVYVLDPSLFDQFQLPTQFSIEKDFLFPNASLLKPAAFVVDDYFIDIGVPADYALASTALPELTK